MVMPALAREKCEPAQLPPPPSPTKSDVQEHALNQLGALEICDGKRALAVSSADLFNAHVDQLVTDLRPAKGWEKLFGKKKPKPSSFDRLTYP